MGSTSVPKLSKTTSSRKDDSKSKTMPKETVQSTSKGQSKQSRKKTMQKHDLWVDKHTPASKVIFFLITILILLIYFIVYNML